MDVLDWLHNAIWSRAQDFVIAQLGVENGGLEPKPIEIGKSYVTVRMKAARIGYIRKWSGKFHSCINCRAIVLHEEKGNLELQTVLAPAKLGDLDPAHLDRIVSINQTLLGPVPYRGRLDLTVGLFSVKSTDLSGPYVDLLTSITDASGLSFLNAAKPFIDPLRKGADLLFGNANNSELEIGFEREFDTLTNATYVAMRAPKGSVDLKALRIDPSDYRLNQNNGDLIVQYPYFVVEVGGSDQRYDWIKIPDLKETWEDVRTAFVSARYNDAGNLLSQFERQCRASPDLVLSDALRLVELARERFTAANSASGFGPVGKNAPALPKFEDMGLYPSGNA